MDKIINNVTQIIKKVNSILDKERIALFLRHSIREEIKNATANDGFIASLTEEGRDIAKKFGKMLPVEKKLRLYSSPVPR